MPTGSDKSSGTKTRKPKESMKKKKESNDISKNEKAQDALNVSRMQTVEEPERYPKMSPFRPEKRTSYKKDNGENSDTLLRGLRNNDSSKTVRTKSLNREQSETINSSSVIKKNSINISALKAAASKYASPRKIIIVTVVCLIAFAHRPIFEHEDKIEAIKEKFPKQNDKFWKSIVSGLNFTIQSKTSISYIFLYETDGEETIKKLVLEVSKYAVFKLRKSPNSAINFTEEIIESHEFKNVTDYGDVIPHLKEKLETNGVMIIENFEKVPEKYALAFHNFCDDVTPLVKKSAFFFTIKVDKFQSEDILNQRNVENLLKENWPNIEEDRFGPLYTRVSSMILNVLSNDNLEDS